MMCSFPIICRRQGAMRDLALPILDADGGVVEKGWTDDRIGALVGLTNQRARDIAKPQGPIGNADAEDEGMASIPSGSGNCE